MVIALIYSMVALGDADVTGTRPLTSAPSRHATRVQPAEETRAPANTFLLQHDSNSDRRLTPDELPKYLAKRFRQADADDNGLLDAREVLLANNRIGRRARKAENVRLTRRGTLIEKGRGGGVLAFDKVPKQGQFRLGSEIGVSDSGRMMADPQFQQAQGLDADRVLPSEPAEAVTTSSERIRTGTDDLPTAPQIIGTLDRNRNGVVDRNEAVDKLADRFKMLDKDKSGGLDVHEIERGLRLARLFGIKPNYLGATSAPGDARMSQ